TYEAVEKLYNDGCRLYITGMSDGFDLIGGQAVIDLKQKYSDVKLMAVVPFVGQEERYTIQDQATYDFVLEHSDEVVTLAEKFVDDSQYLRRNDYMLERATHIVCYFDGRRGGTMYTYNRAKKAGLEIINICE
ncbi:MAG: SLOG family protein, partial [Rikenellaceae bacterium]